MNGHRNYLPFAVCLALGSLGALRGADTPAPADGPDNTHKVTTDWRWIQGAVFVPTNAVNEAQEWDEYDPAINDRELHYASVYGINCVRVFLHYLVYEKKKDELLRNIEDFLARASKYHIKVDFVFFDNCWNQPPGDLVSAGYAYPAPIYGVHNSRWLKSPGDDILGHYAQNKDGLKAYVQDIVSAHKNDSRIVFWETFNEPDRDSEGEKRLMADARRWIHDAGASQPVTATGGGKFSGDPYSDFKSWHNYSPDYWIGGNANSLCTECVNRSEQNVAGAVRHFKDKTGFIMWELGIGRDNCRFSWEHDKKNAAKGEVSLPFHGLIYPDGHPWSLDDVRGLMGLDAFAHAPLFTVEYYLDPAFTAPGKQSVAPMIDFDLNEEKGTNVPDNSIKMPDSNWSVRWTGQIAAPQSGDYTFTVDGDNLVKLIVAGRTVIDKTQSERSQASGVMTLLAQNPVPVEVDYVHAKGPSSLHVGWSGPGLAPGPLTPVAR